jgi:pyruvate ferredoxin oxidoreductase beta subunit
MEKYVLYVPKLVQKTEKFAPGHRACIGCGEALAVRIAFKALGNNIIVANATGCMEIVASQLPAISWQVPWIHTLFENTAAVASGIESAYKVLRRKGGDVPEGTKIIAIAGDGGTADIGLQALSGAMERGHDFVYICFDNEGYMNTGTQRSSATPFGAMTTTSPPGRKSIGQFSWKKDVPAIAVAHNIPYVATEYSRPGLRSCPFRLPQRLAYRQRFECQDGQAGRRKRHVPAVRGHQRGVQDEPGYRQVKAGQGLPQTAGAVPPFKRR